MKSVDQEICQMFFSEASAHFLQFFFVFEWKKPRYLEILQPKAGTFSADHNEDPGQGATRKVSQGHIESFCQDLKRQVRVVDLYNEVMSSDFFFGEIAYVFIHESN